jgi:hypothetical protein
MTSLYIAASIVLVLTGAVHSIIGELMIFRKLSKESIVPNQSAPPLSLAGGLLVLVGTKARHPGWIALTLAAVLIWLALRASATV